MYCPNCRKEIIDDSNYCVYCREVLNPALPQTDRPRPAKVLAGFLAAFIGMLACFFIGGYFAVKNYRSDAITGSIVVGFILLSICPSLILYMTGKKSHARGVFFGTLTFYILLATFFIIITTSY